MSDPVRSPKAVSPQNDICVICEAFSNENVNGGELNAVSDDEVETDEARPVKTQKDPMLPSEDEIKEHLARNHVPSRNWCGHCIMGK